MSSRLVGHGGRRASIAVLAIGVLLAGCSGAGPGHLSVKKIASHPPTTASPTTTVTTTTTPPQPIAPSTTASLPSATTSFVERLSGVGSAGQVIVVTASGYGQPTAVMSAYQKQGDSWTQVFGPWAANLGYNGFAPPGAKREGDGHTPSGSYPFDFFFGVDPNPGVRFPYRQVTGPYLVWDDDPASPSYNEWVDARTQSPGASPEPMDQTPAYDYGAVIAYNSDRVPDAGSAIFLHESTGGPTAGCVSLPAPELLQVLTWLDPTENPRIVMGPLQAITT